jgi:LPXTG-motif cell wall-anchored protein
MKKSQLLHIIAYFGLICALFSGVVSVLAQDGTGIAARVTPIWQPTETPTPGTVVKLTVFFINDYTEPLIVQRVGVHIDWMDEENYVGHDFSDDPVTVPINGGQTFSPITIPIPQDVSVGTHEYVIGVDGLLQNSTAFSWDSSSRALQILGSGGEDGTNGGNGGNGGSTSDGQSNQLLIIVGVAAVAGVALLILVLIFRRKKKQPHTR